MAVRGARTHLGTVRGQPRNLQTRVEACFRQHFAQQQDALAAEARDAHFEVDLCSSVIACGIAFRQIRVGHAQNARQIGECGSGFRLRCRLRSPL